jgi:mediator of RNA polymerase II transcription subunit 12
MTGTRFEQVRTFRQWLLPALQKHVARYAPNRNFPFGRSSHLFAFCSNNDRPSALKAYLVTVELMTSTKCFHSVLDVRTYFCTHRWTV